MKLELTQAIKYHDEELKALDLELENLTGADVLNVESELKAAGENVAAWEYSRVFLLGVAARACHLPFEVMKTLGLNDFMRVINEVLAFFAGGVSAGLTAQNSGVR